MKCSHINKMETKPNADSNMQDTYIWQLSTPEKLEVLKCKALQYAAEVL